MEINRKLLEILLDLNKKSRSGILRAQKDSAKRQLVLHNGRLAFAESNLPNEHLARIMVAMDLLPRANLSEVASLMKTGKTSEEAILALSGADADLEKGRREQAFSIMASLLGWSDCEVHFYPGDSLVRHELNLGLDLSELISESLRYGILKHLLVAPPGFFNQSFSVDDLAGKASVFSLNRIELYACSLLDHPTPAADLLPLIPAGEAGPEGTLLFLYLLGIIKLANSDNEKMNADLPSGSDNFARKLEEMLHRFESASLYEVLAVSTEASQEEIQSAYHLQAKQLHPDLFQSSEFSDEIRSNVQKIFASINEAYLTLKNPETRAAYEEKRSVAKGKKEPADETPEKTAEALFKEGRILFAKGELDTAVERLKGCVWLCPQKAAYHHYLGVAESEVPKLRKDAELHLLKAIELEDMSADTHVALAKLYIKVNLPRKSELQIQKALLWDQDNAEALKLAAELKKILHKSKASTTFNLK